MSPVKVYRILCFGDSHTLGVGDLELGGWVSRLNLKCQNFFTDPAIRVEVYNLGIGSETTDGLKRRIENEVTARRLKGQPVLCVFQYGSNDVVIHKNKNRVPFDYFLSNIIESTAKARLVLKEVCVLSPTRVSEQFNGLKNFDSEIRLNKDVDEYSNRLRLWSDDNEVTFIDCNELAQSEVFHSDGLHWNETLHSLVAVKVFDFITNYVKH